MVDSANKHRVIRRFSVGDYVMLNTKYYQLKKPARSEKFLPRFCGPFRVLACVGTSAYKLALPPACKIHPVVHVSKLWFYTRRPDSLQLPLPVLLENANTFAVLDILKHRSSPNNRQYLVQWKGSDVLYNTWEPESSLLSCSHLVSQYEATLSALPPVHQVPVIRHSMREHVLQQPSGGKGGSRRLRKTQGL